FSHPLMIFAAVMTFLIMVVGIFGNLLTVVALLKCPKVRNVAAAFIISLCVADLLFCALVLPFQGLRFVQGTWRHGKVLCRLIPFIQYGNIGVSLLCIAMITINRYVMITHHGFYARIYKRHWIGVMIAACWVFSYGMQLPTLLGSWGRFDYDSRLQTCSIMSDRHGHSSKTTLFIIAFVIPCLVIIACYAKIFWVVHKSEQRLKQHASKQNSIPNNLRPPPSGTSAGTTSSGGGGDCQPENRVSSDSSSSFCMEKPETVPSRSGSGQKQQPTRVKDQREVRAKRNEWRITKMVLAIFLSFVVCYLPITIVKVADKNVEHPTLHICSYILLYLSACINPIIYVIMNKQYRKAYKTVVFCQPARLLFPFGKANGASNAAEKWKDTGLSNNHSRTIVSQMSGGGTGTGVEQPEAESKSKRVTAVVSMEASLELITRGQDLTSKSNLPQQCVTPPPPSVLTATPNGSSSESPNNQRLPVKKNNHSYTNSGFNSSPGIGTSIFRSGAGSLGIGASSIRRITMVGDDIILEEEESTPPTPTETSTPQTPAPPPPLPGLVPSTDQLPLNKAPKSHIYINVGIPKIIQTHSQVLRCNQLEHSNRDPDSDHREVSVADSKLTEKIKFPID
ncbi:hypothetical protein KR018_005694, partial [Drosophila ironensis]